MASYYLRVGLFIASVNGFTKAHPPPDYAPFSLSAFIPYDYSDSNALNAFTEPVTTSVQISGGSTTKTFDALIDTGTCGLVISAADLPGWNAANASNYPRGWEFLSSSKILYAGHWIPYEMAFTNAAVTVKAVVPILAVERKVTCPSYNETVDTDVCPTSTGSTNASAPLPTGTRLMGIGFGRQWDGQPQGTLDKNAFLNIVEIDGVKITERSPFRPGYIITKQGITVGLTAANMHPYKQRSVKLAPYNTTRSSTHAPGLHDWAQVPVCIGVNDGPCYTGIGLIDTGINTSNMHIPSGTAVSQTNPPYLDNGQMAHWKFGHSDPGYVVSENIVVGDPQGIVEGIVPISEALYTFPPSTDTRIRVNTGRHFYRKWSVAFDAVFGSLGFAPV